MPMLFVIDMLEPGVDRIELELGIEVYLPPKKQNILSNVEVVYTYNILEFQNGCIFILK